MEIWQNPIVNRIQGGTVRGDLDLCASCRHAVVRNGSATGFAEVRCGNLPMMPRVTEKLAYCSAYLEKGKLSLSEMNDIAWVIEERGKKIGFLSPEELDARRRNSAPHPIGF